MINEYRKEKGLNELRISDNLVKSSEKHLLYLIKKNSISHRGEDGQRVMHRAVNEGATGLEFGEILGYSPDTNTLFKGWLLSPEHKKVLDDPSWNWFGLSVKTTNGVYVSVVNFSSGILGSTRIKKEGDVIEFVGLYSEKPNFSIINVKKLEWGKNSFKLIFNVKENPGILTIKDRNNKISDRMELFFLLEY